MELIDTHCHLTFEPLAGDIEAVIERSRAAGITGWITIGTDPQHNQKAIELAGNVKIVAIGETGLDFHYNFSKQTAQRRIFVQQLKIAQELNFPVIIHSRDAFEETIDILEQFGSGVKKVVFHCFSGSPEQANLVLDKGFYISLTGVVTFKNASKTQQVAKIVPTDRLMLETDCPYMSPEPMRKQKINEPALMFHTAKFLAELRQMSLSDFAHAVTATSRSFFSLPG